MSQSTASDHAESIRNAFHRFVPVAVRGLERMVNPDGRWFCFLAREGPDGGLRLEGKSERYSAMSLIGLAQGIDLGTAPNIDTGPIADALHQWAPGARDLGDAGLVLWAEILRRDDRAEATATAILRRKDEIAAKTFDLASMENGCLLVGLAEAMRAGIGGQPLATFADDVAAALSDNQHRDTGLFSFGRKMRRKNVHRARMDHRLGSFASQVYPILGFSSYARAGGSETARAIATRCADRLCDLQGDQGQWWWIYHTHKPEAATRYPVYAVHQDAMGPIALLAAAAVHGTPTHYDEAIHRSFSWFGERPELPAVELIDADRGVVWRAVQHDEPSSTGRLGLGASELARVGRSAWLGSVDRRTLTSGQVCRECRPYHLGWILLAAGLFATR